MGQRAVDFRDDDLWSLSQFLLDAARREGDKEAAQLLAGVLWCAPGVVAGIDELGKRINRDKHFRSGFIKLMRATRKSISAFGSHVPAEVMNSHVDRPELVYYTRDYPTHLLLQQLDRLARFILGRPVPMLGQEP